MLTTIEDLKAKLAELRDFLQETSGKLAALTSVVASALAYVSSDPTLALWASEVLPGPLRFAFILALMVVTYILPHWAKKKDDSNAAGVQDEEA